jgi:transcription-repair coupling factor (superfamily II helicase)
MDTIRLRWNAKKIGFEKILLKNKIFKGYFISNANSEYYQSIAFNTILKFVQQHPHISKMKEDKGKLSVSFSNIKTISEANLLLSKILG